MELLVLMLIKWTTLKEMLITLDCLPDLTGGFCHSCIVEHYLVSLGGIFKQLMQEKHPVVAFVYVVEIK